VAKLIDITAGDPELSAGKDEHELRQLGAQHGIFMNGSTLELELWTSGGAPMMCDCIRSLAESQVAIGRSEEWRTNPTAADPRRLLSDIEAIGKGRFAQRLAEMIQVDSCPDYVKGAITSLAQRTA
jgi:putative ATP-dependent endonuclease of OLD family